MNEQDTFDIESQPYYQLDPNRVMDAVEHLGFYCDGRVMALNSYENRVFQVGIEDDSPLIVKFYRPQRWSDEQIQEEHDFCMELADQGLAVVAPQQRDGQTLFQFDDFRMALFTRRGGHAPELDNEEHLFELGRFLGRLHSIGEQKSFQHRPQLTMAEYGRTAQQHVLNSGLLESFESRYQQLTDQLLEQIDNQLQNFTAQAIRVQGDCHGGNILWRDGELIMLDFDDCRTAPAMQDIWMLLSGDQLQQKQWLNEVAEGYEEYRSFPAKELVLIEPLRALRMIYYSGWLAQRRLDPAFIQAFPQFGNANWWLEHLSGLEQQQQKLVEPPLTLGFY